MQNGILLRVPGNNFEAYATSFQPPVSDGLKYWCFLNDSIEKLGKNLTPGGSAVSVMGVPPVTNKAAVLSTANNIQTSITQTPSMTLIAVGNPVADGSEMGMFISSYRSLRASGLAGTSFGVSLFVGGNDVAAGTFIPRFNVSSYSGVAGATSILNQAILPATDITKPAFMVGTFSITDKVVRLRNMSTGESAQATAFTTEPDVGVAPFTIGASPDASYTNLPRNMSFAAIYNRKLTDAEIELIYARVKPYLAARGVVV